MANRHLIRVAAAGVLLFTPIGPPPSFATGGFLARTRPLCVYPQRAVYNGAGSIDDEKSFTCSAAR